MKSAIIVRYCEIHLKGKNRSFFEKMLKENIKHSLRDVKFTFKSMHSRYCIEDFDENDYAQKLIFDVVKQDLEELKNKHKTIKNKLKEFKEKYNGK